MTFLPDYTSAAELAYFKPDPEWSKPADVAFDTLQTLKSVDSDLDYLVAHRELCMKSSNAIAGRWKILDSAMANIRKHADQYSPLMMKGIESKLADEAKDLDQTNIDFDCDVPSDAVETLKYHLHEFAEIIIRALKKEMGDDECDRFEMNS